MTKKYWYEIGEVLFENLDQDKYDFDFDNASYEEIAEWALNYEWLPNYKKH